MKDNLTEVKKIRERDVISQTIIRVLFSEIKTIKSEGHKINI